MLLLLLPHSQFTIFSRFSLRFWITDYNTSSLTLSSSYPCLSTENAAEYKRADWFIQMKFTYGFRTHTHNVCVCLMCSWRSHYSKQTNALLHVLLLSHWNWGRWISFTRNSIHHNSKVERAKRMFSSFYDVLFWFLSSSYSSVVLCLCCAQIEIYIVHNIVIERKQFPCESTTTRAHTHTEGRRKKGKKWRKKQKQSCYVELRVKCIKEDKTKIGKLPKMDWPSWVAAWWTMFMSTTIVLILMVLHFTPLGAGAGVGTKTNEINLIEIALLNKTVGVSSREL